MLLLGFAGTFVVVRGSLESSGERVDTRLKRAFPIN